MKDSRKYLEFAIKAAIEAGKGIMKIYNSKYAVEAKEDKSPLTEADLKSHKVINRKLKETELPILSEEGNEIPYEKRQTWDQFWLVDPLDGTKEFIKRNGEFTVNIALIEKQKPIAGVIYVPVSKTLYFAEQYFGSYKIEGDFEKNITLSDLLSKATKLPMRIDRPYTVVGSRSHMSKETEAYFEEVRKKQGKTEVISRGSSLKLCMVAEGKADEYPRFAPTMEWDTAAGQAIVEAMGGQVLNYKKKKPLTYNRENLKNDWFLVTSRKG
jgi:3'(2'), 5'-bisphosphate nucleotidase